MSDDSDLFPAFVISHEAWYWSAQGADRCPEISVQMASTGGGVKWEFVIRETKHGVRIEMFSDSWEAFFDYPTLFPAIAALGDAVSLDDVPTVLVEQGFRDVTERETPARYAR